MSKFRHHKYEWTKPFGSVRHSWSVLGPLGGVNFHASVNEQYGDTAGLEFHHTRACQAYTSEAPHHKDCWLTGEPCWHDGTSLYATENLWPMISAMLRGGEHDAIFRVLEGEYNERFKGFEIVERAKATQP